MKIKAWVLVALGLAGAAIVGSPQHAEAIAAFTRQYNTECSTCHNPFPRRNEFGEAFRKNGYVWPGRPAEEKAPAGKEAYWLSGIPETVPLSVSLRMDALYDAELEDDKVSPNTDLFLHLGGTIRDRVGFFAHDLLGSAEAFAVFRRLADTPVNVKVGKLAPQTTLWKENQGMTVTPPAPLAFSVEGGGNPLTTPRDTVELNLVLGSRLFAAAGVSDRRNQDTMEAYGHLSYKIGGTDFLGGEPELDFDEESVWDFLTVTLGSYVYAGRIDLETHSNDFYRVGLEAEAQYKGLTLLVSGVRGHDEDVDGFGLQVDSAVFAAELDYFFAPRFLTATRFENEDVGNAPRGIVKRLVQGFVYMPVENLQVRLEGKWARSQDAQDPVDVTGLFQLQYHL